MTDRSPMTGRWLLGALADPRQAWERFEQGH